LIPDLLQSLITFGALQSGRVCGRAVLLERVSWGGLTWHVADDRLQRLTTCQRLQGECKYCASVTCWVQWSANVSARWLDAGLNSPVHASLHDARSFTLAVRVRNTSRAQIQLVENKDDVHTDASPLRSALRVNGPLSRPPGV